MKKPSTILIILLILQSVIIIWIGFWAIKNSTAYHCEYTKRIEFQSECSILKHAIVENINYINTKEEIIEIIYKQLDAVQDSTLVVLFSKDGCGGCAISLVNQMIDDGANNIRIILECANSQIENTFANERKVTTQVCPLLFQQEHPSCRVISISNNYNKMMVYYPELSEYMHFVL